MGMTKEDKIKIKQDPERYKKYLENRRRYRKKYRERLKKDPHLKEKFLESCNNLPSNISKRKAAEIKANRKKLSPYWSVKGWKRYKKRVFRTMTNQANKRCKAGKLSPIELWSIAKKQKLICPLTGEKLTSANISVDHIKPISKGGSNDVSNIQLITRRANTIKNDMTYKELLYFCRNIIQRLAPMVIE
jgi:5-methylcytosine-specific restriction endonuclease McrA